MIGQVRARKLTATKQTAKRRKTAATAPQGKKKSTLQTAGLFSENANERETSAYMRPFSRSLPMMLLLAREAVMVRFRRLLRESGLNEQQWRVLRALVEVPHLDITELSKRVYILKPSLTRMLKSLEAANLVKRDQSPTDQRYAYISITPTGRRKFQAVAPFSEAEYHRIEQEYGPEKLGELYSLLEDLITQFAAGAPPGPAEDAQD
jgi:homoprotocatechuate degradation regulator HpaR